MPSVDHTSFVFVKQSGRDADGEDGGTHRVSRMLEMIATFTDFYRKKETWGSQFSRIVICKTF